MDGPLMSIKQLRACRRSIAGCCGVLIILISCFSFAYSSQKDKKNSIDPVTNRNKPWRIGYYEGGPYENYVGHLRAVVAGLQEIGWLNDFTVPDIWAPEDAKSLWDFLCAEGSGKYIEFVQDAFWSADWDNENRKKTRSSALIRLREKGDIDLILALGTWAGQDLACNEHTVPTIVLSTSDPIGAGIIKSAEKSGYRHVHARVDEDKYKRQIRLFYDIFSFASLGVVYENSPEGRLYSNIPDLREMAAELGFEIVERHVPDIGLSDEECVQMVKAAYSELAEVVDVQWIGAHRGESPQYLPQILQPLLDRGIPTWAAEGAVWVKNGALMSISRMNLSDVGVWTAGIIAQVLRGTAPGDLSQFFRHPDAIAINMTTARKIGYDPPPGILEIADEIYK
jgi:ABC-type uncharacterized transport system substrate-binding protein